jgi:hypothetical protein
MEKVTADNSFGFKLGYYVFLKPLITSSWSVLAKIWSINRTNKDIKHIILVFNKRYVL